MILEKLFQRSDNTAVSPIVAKVKVPFPDTSLAVVGPSAPKEREEMGEASVLPCDSCDAHYIGWCRAVTGKTYYNVRFLKLCPRRLPDDFPTQARQWNCVGCVYLNFCGGIYWCAGEPDRFRNISGMDACPGTGNKGMQL